MDPELYRLWRTFEFNANLELARLHALEQEADELLHRLDNRTRHVTFANTDLHFDELSLEAQPSSSPPPVPSSPPYRPQTPPEFKNGTPQEPPPLRQNPHRRRHPRPQPGVPSALPLNDPVRLGTLPQPQQQPEGPAPQVLDKAKGSRSPPQTPTLRRRRDPKPRTPTAPRAFYQQPLNLNPYPRPPLPAYRAPVNPSSRYGYLYHGIPPELPPIIHHGHYWHHGYQRWIPIHPPGHPTSRY
jgi:hypothetical protein